MAARRNFPIDALYFTFTATAGMFALRMFRPPVKVQQRTIPRSGKTQIERIGLPKNFFTDLYHRMLGSSWTKLLSAIAALYVCANVFFAGFYMLDPGGISHTDGSFADAFYFSVQTMATIGYGVLTPQSTYTHLLVTCESLVGLLTTAMAAGLMFAKFSQARARVMFSKVAIVTARDGVPSLMFRMANLRGNQIVDARLHVVLARDERTQEGEWIRRLYDLKLTRDHMLTFALSWTAVHQLDSTSPLFGKTPEQLAADSSEILVSLIGIDDTVMQTVHMRFSYLADEIIFGKRFNDILKRHEDGKRYVDYSGFHDTLPESREVA